MKNDPVGSVLMVIPGADLTHVFGLHVSQWPPILGSFENQSISLTRYSRAGILVSNALILVLAKLFTVLQCSHLQSEEKTVQLQELF